MDKHLVANNRELPPGGLSLFCKTGRRYVFHLFYHGEEPSHYFQPGGNADAELPR